MTLDDVTIELKQSNKNLHLISQNTNDTTEYLNLAIDTFKNGFDKLISQNSNETTEYLNLATDTFKNGFNDLIEFFKGRSLLELEKAREDKEAQNDLLDAIKDLKSSQLKSDTIIVKGLLDDLAKLGLILGAVVSAIAIAAGAFASYIKNLVTIGKRFKDIAKALTPSKLLISITKAFDSIGDFMKMKFVKASTAFSSAITSISTFFKSIGTFFKTSLFKIPGVEPLVKNIGRAITALSSVITGSGAISETASKIGDVFGRFKSVFKLIFKFVSRIFAPLFTLYETVKGIWEGYQKDGLVGALEGGITGFFKGFIGDFLNILKDGAAWIASKLGFDNAAEVLNSFDFNVMFKTIVSGIFDFFGKAVNFFKEQFNFDNIKKELDSIDVKGFVTDFGKKITDGIKGMLRSVLPKPSSNVTDLSYWTSKVIPDAVYEFAGMNPSTGDVIQPPAIQAPSIKKGEMAGNQMNEATVERNSMEYAPKVPNINAVNSNTINNVSNNSNTTVVKPPPSPTRRPDNASEILWDSGANFGA
jgi:hypothetical protein